MIETKEANQKIKELKKSFLEEIKRKSLYVKRENFKNKKRYDFAVKAMNRKIEKLATNTLFYDINYEFLKISSSERGGIQHLFFLAVEDLLNRRGIELKRELRIFIEDSQDRNPTKEKVNLQRRSYVKPRNNIFE